MEDSKPCPFKLFKVEQAFYQLFERREGHSTFAKHSSAAKGGYCLLEIIRAVHLISLVLEPEMSISNYDDTSWILEFLHIWRPDYIAEAFGVLGALVVAHGTLLVFLAFAVVTGTFQFYYNKRPPGEKTKTCFRFLLKVVCVVFEIPIVLTFVRTVNLALLDEYVLCRQQDPQVPLSLICLDVVLLTVFSVLNLLFNYSSSLADLRLGARSHSKVHLVELVYDLFVIIVLEVLGLKTYGHVFLGVAAASIAYQYYWLLPCHQFSENVGRAAKYLLASLVNLLVLVAILSQDVVIVVLIPPFIMPVVAVYIWRLFHKRRASFRDSLPEDLWQVCLHLRFVPSLDIESFMRQLPTHFYSAYLWEWQSSALYARKRKQFQALLALFKVYYKLHTSPSIEERFHFYSQVRFLTPIAVDGNGDLITYAVKMKDTVIQDIQVTENILLQLEKGAENVADQQYFSRLEQDFQKLKRVKTVYKELQRQYPKRKAPKTYLETLQNLFSQPVSTTKQLDRGSSGISYSGSMRNTHKGTIVIEAVPPTIGKINSLTKQRSKT